MSDAVHHERLRNSSKIMQSMMPKNEFGSLQLANPDVDPIPHHTTAAAAYGPDEGPRFAERVSKRIKRLDEKFVARFGHPPEVYARAPGRVNIIGEHIDYEGYAVLPMAIFNDTIVAVRASTPPQPAGDGSESDSSSGGAQLRVANVEDGFPESLFDANVSEGLPEPFTWAHYFLCGFKGMWRHVLDKGGDGALKSTLSGGRALTRGRTRVRREADQPRPSGTEPCALDVMVDGNIPKGFGLSSSSSLVCASAIAVMGLHGLRCSKKEMAELCASAERLTGTQGGGMDQAVSLLALNGVAKLVEFGPLRTSNVALPRGVAFIVANCLVPANKAQAAKNLYNLRVLECQLAARLIAMSKGSPRRLAIQKVHTLRDVEALYFAGKGAGGEQAGASTNFSTEATEQALEAARAALHEEAYTHHELEEELFQQPLTEIYADQPALLAASKAAKIFRLLKRAEHVYSEALRVRNFQAICAKLQNVDDPSIMDQLHAQLGELLNASHASLRDNYECSTTQMDTLVAELLKGGALGARITGAGWGGCAVAIADAAKVDDVINAVKKSFYQAYVGRGMITRESVDSHIFTTKPGGGASIIQPNAREAANRQ